MLTNQLRSLEEDGLIYRKVYPVFPPKVEYGLSELGENIVPMLKEMYNLPSRPFLDIANIVTQIRAGYSFGKAEAIEQVKKSTTPTLFIHGDKDRFVSFKMLNQLY